MIKFKDILTESTNTISVPDVAWLAFLIIVYNSKMKLSSWSGDKRMGPQTCLESLSKFNCVSIDSDNIIINDENAALEIINKYFKADNLDEASKLKEKYKQYDTASYKVSNLPYELYWFNKRRNSPIVKTLSSNDYHLINNFIDKYTRGETRWQTEMEQFLGRTNELIDDTEYKLFRGIFIHSTSEFIDTARNLKTTSKIKDSKMSWTHSLEIAELFAKGAKGNGDITRLKPGDIGIILSYKFDKDDILIDFDYLDEMHTDTIELPGHNESEVIVRPFSKSADVYKIITN